MNKILTVLTAALSFVFGSRETVAALKIEIANRDQIITDLRAAVEVGNADDASLEAAALAAREAQAKAESDLAAVLAANTEAEAKADELAAAISADPTIPLTVAADGTVTPS